MKKFLTEYALNEKDFHLVEESCSNYDIKKDFSTLDAWKKARLVKLFFYKKIIPLLPPLEKNNLDIQMRKAAISITANISEGYGRYHYQECAQFCRISRASLYELKDHLISCFDLEYINKNLFDEGISLIENAKITLNGYIKFVITQKSKK